MGLLDSFQKGVQEAAGAVGVNREEKPLTGMHLSRKVGAGVDSENSETIKSDKTLEDANFRIFSGAEDTLRLNLYKEDKETGNRTKIVDTPGGDDYIGGNDDYHEFDVSVAFRKGDKLILEYKNTDNQNPHRYKVNLSFDKAGGILSVLPFM